jgi:hypothetical protein
MGRLRTKQGFFLLIILAIIATSTGTLLFLLRDNFLLFYPGATVVISLVLSLGIIRYDFSPDIGQDFFIDVRILDIALLILFSSLALITGSRTEFPPSYFILILVTSLVLIYRIESIVGASTLGYIIIFSLVIRANIWYSAPYFTKDARLHIGITGFVRKTGRMVPYAVDDYHDYPLADIFSGMVSILTQTDEKHALFLSIGVAGVFAFIFVYVFVRRVFSEENDKIAAYAALFSSISAYNLAMTSAPKPQILATSLLIAAIFVIELYSPKRRVLLIFVLVSVMIFTHPLAPVLLSGILILYYVVRLSINKIKLVYQGPPDRARHMSILLTGLVVFMMIFRRFVQVGHLRIQILRIRSAFIASDATGLPNFAGSRGPTTTSHILIELDHLLLQAGTLLVFGLIAGVGGISFIYFRILEGEQSVVSNDWLVLSLLLFGGFSVALIGSTATARRAAMGVMAASIPIVMYGVYWTQRRWGGWGRITIALILVSATFFGIANPAVYITNRSSGFEPLMYDSELAMLDHFHKHSLPVIDDGPMKAYSDSYTGVSTYTMYIGKGKNTPKNIYFNELVERKHHRRISQEYINKSLAGNDNTVYLYRTYFAEYAGMKPPPDSNIVYTSGKSRILM